MATRDTPKLRAAWTFSSTPDDSLQVLKELEDREAEADERERRPHDGHQRAVGAHARALERQARPLRGKLERRIVRGAFVHARPVDATRRRTRRGRAIRSEGHDRKVLSVGLTSIGAPSWGMRQKS